ncbi:MAG TPA: hypothetical protein DCW90_09080 [Lachnospiraceae bacterium]|nr:hypothetical protein [Lachnospiraceae bacterium]
MFIKLPNGDVVTFEKLEVTLMGIRINDIHNLTYSDSDKQLILRRFYNAIRNKYQYFEFADDDSANESGRRFALIIGDICNAEKIKEAEEKNETENFHSISLMYDKRESCDRFIFIAKKLIDISDGIVAINPQGGLPNPIITVIEYAQKQNKEVLFSSKMLPSFVNGLRTLPSMFKD